VLVPIMNYDNVSGYLCNMHLTNVREKTYAFD
jgi:hypothetical protein